MNKNDFNYVEIVKNSARNRGCVVKLPEISNIALDYYGKEDVINGFHSTFMHTVDLLNYVDTFGSIRGYDGHVFTDWLYWDMDSGTLEKAKTDTIELVERLKCNSNNVRIYFSGGKGFHVLFYCPELEGYIDNLIFNDIVKNACIKLADGLGSFDSKIYDKTRIIRTTNSKHGISGLYKIEITYDELKKLSVDEILELAKTPRKLEFKLDLNGTSLSEVLKDAAERKQIKRSSILCGTEMLEGVTNGFELGKRNSGFASLAGLLHSRNFDVDFILAVISGLNRSSDAPLSESEIESIVNSISKYPVNEIYIEPKNKDICTIADASKDWYSIIERCGYTSFGNRFEQINSRMKLCIPGDVIAIVANSGVGKTSIAMELGNNEAKQKLGHSLLASLEMSRAGLFFRAATMESLKRDVDNYIPSSEVAKELLEDLELNKKVLEEWKHLLIIDRGGLSIDKIVEYYHIGQEMTQGKIANLVIDYAQNLDKAEEISYAMMMARKFKSIAKELNTKLFVVMQCNKTMPDDFTPVSKNHIEGGGAYFHACDYIMGFWKSQDHNNRLHGSFIKDRWGSTDYRFDMVREGLKYHSENYVPDRPRSKDFEL